MPEWKLFAKHRLIQHIQLRRRSQSSSGLTLLTTIVLFRVIAILMNFHLKKSWNQLIWLTWQKKREGVGGWKCEITDLHPVSLYNFSANCWKPIGQGMQSMLSRALPCWAATPKPCLSKTWETAGKKNQHFNLETACLPSWGLLVGVFCFPASNWFPSPCATVKPGELLVLPLFLSVCQPIPVPSSLCWHLPERLLFALTLLNITSLR